MEFIDHVQIWGHCMCMLHLGQLFSLMLAVSISFMSPLFRSTDPCNCACHGCPFTTSMVSSWFYLTLVQPSTPSITRHSFTNFDIEWEFPAQRWSGYVHTWLVVHRLFVSKVNIQQLYLYNLEYHRDRCLDHSCTPFALSHWVIYSGIRVCPTICMQMTPSCTLHLISLETTSQNESLNKLQNCVSRIKSWMTTNKLILNENKTEVICISSNYFNDQVFIATS